MKATPTLVVQTATFKVNP